MNSTTQFSQGREASASGRASGVRVRAHLAGADTLAYRSYTNGSAQRSIVLLHGLGSAGQDWSLQTADLVRRWQVITVDLPGHGESPPVRRRTSIPGLSRLVQHTVHTVLGQQPVLMGHSLGGLTALQMVLDNPGDFSALILVNAVPHMRLSRHSIRQAAGRLPDALLGRMDELAAFVAEEHFPYPQQDLLRRLAVRRIRSVERATYLRLMTAILGFDVRRRLGSISIPVLVVSGVEDKVFSLRDKQILAERIPGASWVEMDGSGHASPQDSPQQFNRILRDFLDTLD